MEMFSSPFFSFSILSLTPFNFRFQTERVLIFSIETSMAKLLNIQTKNDQGYVLNDSIETWIGEIGQYLINDNQAMNELKKAETQCV